MSTPDIGYCCICLKSYSFLDSIYDEDYNGFKHFIKLRKCIPNEIWYKDYKMCKNCIEKLDTAFEFVCVCVENENKRKEIYGKSGAPYVCIECNKSYKIESALKRHVRLTQCKNHDSGNSCKNTEVPCNNEVDIGEINEPKCEEHEIKTDLEQQLNDKVVYLKEEDVGFACESFSSPPTPKPDSSSDDEIPLKPIPRKRRRKTGASKREYKRKITRKTVVCKTFDLYIEEQSESSKCEQGVETLKDTENTSKAEEDTSKTDEISNDEEQNNKEDEAKPKRKAKRGPYKCKYCDEIFKLTLHLQKHVLSVHSYIRPYRCEQCNNTYKTQLALVSHQKRHSGERPYMCQFCGKSYKGSQDLLIHSKIHDPVRGYKCNQCEKSFKTAGNLKRHKVCVHTRPEDYEFQCAECGKKFPFKDLLNYHMARHVGAKNYSCHICDKKFIVQNDLSKHTRLVHRCEQRSSCPECGKELKTIFGLRKHLKTAHGLGGFKEAEKKLPCPYCPKMFDFNNKLKKHILIHTGERPFKCDKCVKGFRTRFELKTHLNNAHQVDL